MLLYVLYFEARKGNMWCTACMLSEHFNGGLLVSFTFFDIRRRVWESNPRHIGGTRALSALRHLCSPKILNVLVLFSRKRLALTNPYTIL